MSKVTINELAGSYDQNYFIQGLLLASKDNSLGEMWEKSVTCPHCLFAKSCGLLSEQMEARGQNPRCGQVVDILLGDLSPEDESIPELLHYPDMGKSIL
jgi:hypothetical protein